MTGVAVVTVNRGLGRATAVRLAADGFAVAATGRDLSSPEVSAVGVGVAS